MSQRISMFAVAVRDYDEALAFYVDKLAFEQIERDPARLVERGVTFVRPRSEQPYGIVAVFEDLHGNQFDLIERRRA